jgi:hypothetical protein
LIRLAWDSSHQIVLGGTADDDEDWKPEISTPLAPGFVRERQSTKMHTALQPSRLLLPYSRNIGLMHADTEL